MRLTDRERQKVEHLARKLEVSMSEVIQDWIKTLPEPANNSQPLLSGGKDVRAQGVAPLPRLLGNA